MNRLTITNASTFRLNTPPQLVRVSGDHFEFLKDGVVVYDCDASNTGDALRWIEHIAPKTWVTKEHLEQFARLVASKFGVGHR